MRGVSVVFNKNNSVLLGKSTSGTLFFFFYEAPVFFNMSVLCLPSFKQVSYADIERNFLGG